MSYWIVNTLGFGIAAISILYINRIVRDPWNYVNIFSFFYASALAGSQIWFGIVLESEYKLTDETLIIFFLSWWAFLFGSVLFLRGLKPISKITVLKYLKKRNSRNVLFFLIAANFLYNIAILNVNGTFSALAHMDSNLIDTLAANRIANSGDLSKGHVGWYFELWHIAYIYYVPLAMYMYRMGYTSKRFAIGIAIYGLINSLILFSRIQFLMLLVVIFVAWTMLFHPSYKVVLSKAATLLSLTFLLFVGMQAYISNNEILPSESTLVERVVTYAFSPLPSYQVLLNGGYEEANPHDAFFTLQAMYFFAGKLGFLDATEYPIGFREYVFAPYPTNVYTFLDAFTLDFGPTGAVIGSFLMGTFVAFIYRRLSERINFSTLLIYSVSVYGCGVAMLINMFIQHVFFLQIATILIINMLLSITINPRKYNMHNLNTLSHSR